MAVAAAMEALHVAIEAARKTKMPVAAARLGAEPLAKMENIITLKRSPATSPVVDNATTDADVSNLEGGYVDLI